MADAPSKPQPSKSDAKYSLAIIRYTRTKRNVDWQAVAGEYGESVRVIKNRFYWLRRKFRLSKSQKTTANTNNITGSAVEQVSEVIQLNLASMAPMHNDDDGQDGQDPKGTYPQNNEDWDSDAMI